MIVAPNQNNNKSKNRRQSESEDVLKLRLIVSADQLNCWDLMSPSR